MCVLFSLRRGSFVQRFIKHVRKPEPGFARHVVGREESKGTRLYQMSSPNLHDAGAASEK